MPEIFGAALMGGGSGPAYAAIGVTYPEGATCTCSLGSKTLTAPDTSGQALFIVPTAGEWVVTISQSGQEPKSETVIVTESKAYMLDIFFAIELYKDGVEHVPWSVTVALDTYGRAEKRTTSLYVVNTGGSGVFGGQIRTTNAVNLTKASVIGLTVSSISGNGFVLRVCSGTDMYKGVLVSVSIPGSTPLDTPFEIDVSNVNQNAYIHLGGSPIIGGADINYVYWR